MDDNNNDNDNDTHPPQIIVRVGMIFRRGQKYLLHNEKMKVAYNSVFRRIFNYRPWQSVRELQACLSRPTWEDLIAKRTEKFLKRIRNDTFLAGLFSP